jgi:hypothetical protein
VFPHPIGQCFVGFTQNSFELGLQPLAAFQRGFVKVREMFQLIGRKGSKFKRVHALTLFKRIWKIQKLLVLSG